MTRPMLTQREAAAACGVSRSTIRRRRELGELSGSVEDPKRGWLIPVEALLAAGFRLNAPAPADASAATGAGQVEADGESQDAAALRAELARVRAEHALALAEERHAKQLAEARVEHMSFQLAERLARIEDLQRAVAALTPAPVRSALVSVAEAGPTVPGQAYAESASSPDDEAAASRRKWWGSRP
ncbi:hypothetical protein [Streptomyces sp. NPDC089919]|uniref:hypothetical protein n=1 Tax=Streptomyces sp. NPDC089919 TaxID=3155188 RepID=UPI003423B246